MTHLINEMTHLINFLSSKMKYFSFCIFLSANLIFYDLNSNKFEKKEFFQNLNRFLKIKII